MPDTTQAPPADTLLVSPGTATALPVGFRGPEPGIPVADSILARLASLDVPDLLAAVPASFVYAFGTPGWPEGWSPYGLNPQRVALLFGGLPFNDPVTGRPRYDLLPFGFLNPLRTGSNRLNAPAAVYAELRAYDRPRPLTEMRYMATNTGLQSIYAMHTQRRRRRLFGRDGVVGVLFGYGGHRADGEYPGSRLRRMRQLLGRLRYEQQGWSVELTEFHSRRQLGAHGGVLPQPGLAFESIYTRVGATVSNPDARRQTLRNDLALTARTRLLPGAVEPLTASAYWTAQTFRYRDPGADTLTAKTNRYGGRLQQDLRAGAHRLRLRVEGFTDRLRRSGDALAGAPARPRRQLHAAARDSLRLGRLALLLEGALHATDDATFPGGTIQAAWQAGPLRLFADAGHAGQPVAWVEQSGFGRFVQPVDVVPDGRISQGRLGLALRAGAFDVTVFGFAHEATSPLDLYETTVEDSVVALVAPEAFRRAGVGGDVGWRRQATRGLYLTIQPTLVEFLNADASALHARQDAALPAFFATGRLGARYVLFNDLDLDVSLRGRYWTELRSRTLHPPTGLLVLPALDARLLPASGTLDLVIEGGLRNATLFVAYENALSGTGLLVGNLIVPVYPLPARRFRFGVFWPIFD